MEFVSKVNNKNNYYESHYRLHRKEMMGIRHSFKLSAMELFLVTQKEFTPVEQQYTNNTHLHSKTILLPPSMSLNVAVCCAFKHH